MLFKSPIFAQASGSIAGTVFSRNAGGMYVRSRANPVNPNTGAQQAVRDAMRTLVFTWSNVLTDAQRDGWNTYAFNTPTLNKLGESTSKTGQQMFLRGNIPRAQAILDLALDAPTTFDLGQYAVGDPPDASEATQNITFHYLQTDPWVTISGAALLIYQSRPQNATRTFGKGPYQLAMTVPGANPVGPVQPAVFASLFAFVAGQKFFFQSRVTYDDGRLTGKQNPTLIAAA